MDVKLSQKGWVVIPTVLRKKYGLKTGARLQVVDYGGVLGLIPAADNPVEAAAGMLRGGDSLTEALLAEHRRELENER
ncbi:MAG: AbrB/MazE/SpoVT family DNA-binding domain-containing protein [Chloroflexi bacterium]|nr:AbrB/MazE/SpoVT family DNA-binding domain-containing protein [Chloroflexota bacterium]